MRSHLQAPLASKASVWCILFLVTLTSVATSTTLHMSIRNLTETQVIQGGRFTIHLQGDTWVSPITSAMGTTIINGFKGPAGTSNFEGRKSVLLVSGLSFSLSNNNQDLVVAMESDDQFDIVGTETVNFTAAASLTSTGTSPLNSASFKIYAEQGSITSSVLTLTEDAVRAGGAIVPVTLAPGEQWRNASLVTTFSNIVGSSTMWEATKRRIIVSRLSITVSSDGRTAYFKLLPLDLYDAYTTERIKFMIPSTATASGLVPRHADYELLVITPTAGSYTLSNPTFGEFNIARGNGIFFTISLAAGEAWNANISVAALRTAFTAIATQSQGFNTYKNHLVATQPLRLSDQELRVYMQPHSSFDIDTTETVSFLPSAAMTASGLVPLLQTNGDRTFTLQPSPAIGFTEMFKVIAEEDIMRGTSVNVTLTAGESFKDIAGALAGGRSAIDVRSGMSGSSSSSSGFNALKQAILPTLMPTRHLSKSVELILQPTPDYDIIKTEAISFVVSGSLTRSGLGLLNNTFTLYVRPTSGLLTIDHPFAARELDTQLSFILTEDHIRSGAGVFNLSWSAEETWLGSNFHVGGNMTVVSDFSQPMGWARYGTKKIPTIRYDRGNHDLLLTLHRARFYDIDTLEIVRVFIPTAAISSRLASRDGFSVFQMKISPTRGSPRLCCRTSFTEMDIAAGGLKLVVHLEPGETWVSGWELQWSQALISETPTAEPDGWTRWRSSIVSTSSFEIKNNSREMHITFSAAPKFALVGTKERVLIYLTNPYLPPSIVSSGLPLNRLVLNFTIAKTPPSVNISVSSPHLNELDVRKGGTRVVIHLAHGSFVTGSESAIAEAFQGNVTLATGFNTYRTIILHHVVLTETTATILLQPAPHYNTHEPERISVKLPSAVFASGGETKSMYFSIAPVAGNISCLTRELREEDLKTEGSSNAPTIRLELSPHESWVDAAVFPLKAFMRHIIVRSSRAVASPFGMNYSLPFLFEKATVSVQDTRLTITLKPYAHLDVSSLEILELPLTMEGLVESNVRPLRGDRRFIHVVPIALPSVDPSSGQTPDGNKVVVSDLSASVQHHLSVHLVGGVFVTDFRQCHTDILQNISTSSTDATSAREIWAAFPQMLRVAHSFSLASLRRTLNIKLHQTTPQLEPAALVQVSFSVPPSCVVGGRVAPTRVRFIVDLVPVTIRMVPTEVSEDQLRAGGVNMTLTLSRGGQWNPQKLQSIPTHFRGNGAIPFGFQNRRLRVVGNPPNIQCTPPSTNTAIPNEAQICLVDPSTVTIFTGSDLFLDIGSTNETVTFPPAGNLLLNVTRVVRMVDTMVVYSTPVTGFTVHTRRGLLLQRDLQGASHHHFNLTLPHGETFIDTAAAKTALRDAITSNISVSVAPGGFSAQKSSLVPLDKWILSPNKRTWHIPMGHAASYSIPEGLYEGITVGIPAAAVTSGIAPRPAIAGAASNAVPLFTVIPDPYGPARVHLSVSQVFESQIATGEVNILLQLSGPSRLFNDTWVAAQLVNVYLNSSVSAVDAPTGFNARRNLLRPQYSVLTPSVALMRFGKDTGFDIDRVETISIDVLGSAVASGLAPHVGGFDIMPSAPQLTLSVSPALLNESDIRSETVRPIVWITAAGDQWNQSEATKAHIAAGCTAPTLPNATGEPTWSNRSATLLPSSAVAISTDGRTAILTIQRDVTYDLPSDLSDEITCTFQGMAFRSGLTPAASVSFTILNDGSVGQIDSSGSGGNETTAPETASTATVSSGFKLQTWHIILISVAAAAALAGLIIAIKLVFLKPVSSAGSGNEGKKRAAVPEEEGDDGGDASEEETAEGQATPQHAPSTQREPFTPQPRYPYTNQLPPTDTSTTPGKSQRYSIPQDADGDFTATEDPFQPMPVSVSPTAAPPSGNPIREAMTESHSKPRPPVLSNRPPPRGIL